MKKLPLSVRLFLNVLVFSVPVVVLTYLMYRSETENINFGKKEVLGNRLQRPYEDLFQEVVALRLGEKTSLSSAQEKLAVLKGTLDEVGSDLQFTPEGLAARKRENAQFSEIEKALKESRWTDAVAGIRTAIAHLGDTSNLILDPDLDSYYVMDITLLALPQMQERLQNILAEKEKFFTSPPGESVRIQAALHAALLKESDLSRITADAQTALNEDKNFYEATPSLQAKLPEAVKDLQRQTDVFVGLLEKISRGEAVTEAEFITAGDKTLESSFTSWRTISDEMHVLLSKRIASLESKRASSLYSAGLALFVAILFSFIVGVSVSDSLKQIFVSIKKLRDRSGNVLKVGHQLHGTAREVTEAMTTQSAAIEETAASVEEMNSMIKITAENSVRAANIAQQANTSAESGKETMENMLRIMTELSASFRKIVDTVSVIDDIAFQTNLLALNAAVEAARAGEQGKGFAVVAEAVRSLAQRSSSAAKDITELIKSSVERIENGSRQAEKSGAVLVEIVAAVKKVTEINNEIAAASTEQSNGIAQISKAMNQLDQVTQVNAASSEEAAASAEELSAQAESMTQVIATLVEVVKGSSGKSLHHPAPVVKAAKKAKVKEERIQTHEDLLPLKAV